MFHIDYCEFEVASGFKFMNDLKALFLVKGIYGYWRKTTKDVNRVV